MRALDIVMALLLMAAALVQYNDPDGWTWGAFYGLASVFSLMHAAGRQIRALTAVFAVAAGGLAVWIGLEVVGLDLPLYGSEEGREMMGAAIVAAWAAVLALVPTKRHQVGPRG